MIRNDDLLSIEEAASRVGLPLTEFQELLHSGNGPQLKIYVADLFEWDQSRKSQGVTK